MSATSNGWPRSRKGVGVLLDRCIAPSLALGLRKFDHFDVLTLREIYRNDGMYTPDVEWIEDSAHEGFIVFTANPTMIAVPDERAAIEHHGAKVFCISKPQHTREGKALIYGRHLLQIRRRATRPGPCFWRIGPGTVITRDIP